MTRRQRQAMGQRWSTSVVKAPHAADPSSWDLPLAGEAGAHCTEFLGPPDAESDVRIIHPEPDDPPGSPAAAGTNGHGVAAAPAMGEVPPGRAVSVPASPQDLEGMHQTLLWVSWAVEECSRAYTRVNGRLGEFERRLARLELPLDAPPAPAAPANVGSDVDASLEDMASRIQHHRTETFSRLAPMEQRLRELDFVPLKLSNLQRELDKMRSGQRNGANGAGGSNATGGQGAVPAAAAAQPAAPAATTPPAALNASGEPARLRHDLEVIRKRVQALEARLQADALAAAIEQAVQARAERQAEDAGSGPNDVEAIYRELDSIAEFVASRAAATAEALERIAPLELALLELRRDVSRAGTDTAAHSWQDVDRRLRDLESGLRRVEGSAGRTDRLYEALHGLVGGEGAPQEPPAHTPTGTRGRR